MLKCQLLTRLLPPAFSWRCQAAAKGLFRAALIEATGVSYRGLLVTKASDVACASICASPVQGGCHSHLAMGPASCRALLQICSPWRARLSWQEESSSTELWALPGLQLLCLCRLVHCNVQLQRAGSSVILLHVRCCCGFVVSPVLLWSEKLCFLSGKCKWITDRDMKVLSAVICIYLFFFLAGNWICYREHLLLKPYIFC